MKNPKNKVYQWKGFNLRNEAINGEIEAPNLLIARALLMQQEIKLKKIKKKLHFFRWQGKRLLTTQSITLFTQQIALLLKAGVSLSQSIEIFKNSNPTEGTQLLTLSIKKDLENGLSFSQSLAKHPNLFNSLYCNLILVAEKTASVDVMLEKIADYRENNEHLKKKIKKSLSYPLVVLSVAFLISNLLLIFVIPEFKRLFESFGAQLPFLTQWIINLSYFMKKQWLLVFSLLISFCFGAYFLKRRSPQFEEKWDRSILKLPLVGSILTKAIFARFSRSLALTSLSGFPLIESLETIADTAGNSLYINAIHRIKEEVLCGERLPKAIEKTGLFPSRMIQMLTIGEESGTLGPMLHKTADYYEEEINRTINQLNLFLEPCIMLVLGLLIGILVIALYIPIFKLGSVI